MNKRQYKKYIHKQVLKYHDGCGIMSMLRSPSIAIDNIKPLNTIKEFDSGLFSRDRGIDCTVDIFMGKGIINA